MAMETANNLMGVNRSRINNEEISKVIKGLMATMIAALMAVV